MSPSKRKNQIVPFPKGTNVATKKGISVGKIKEMKKIGKICVKYTIEWFGKHEPSFGEKWYNHKSLINMSEKRVRSKPTLWTVSVDEDVDLFEREKAKRHLRMMPCNYGSDIIDWALDQVRYPYGLQTVMYHILKRAGDEVTKFPSSKKPKPIEYQNEIKLEDVRLGSLTGRTVQKRFDGKKYLGTVIGKSKEWFQVKYEDGDEEELDSYEVIQHLHPRPEIPSCMGRRFVSLELFAGCCNVSDAFYRHGWNVDSTDNNPKSNASMKMDILDLNPHELDRVPDFIWASPPCETYSMLSGGSHRCISDMDYDRSPEARLHDLFFMKMVHIMSWAKSKHPHLLVVIENPRGKLQHMPLMQECVRHFNLQKVLITYCAFGRDEKKPTHLWTNFPALANHLKPFTCTQGRCCVSGYHHSVRSNCSTFNFSSIPEELSTTVARFVNSKFILDNINQLEANTPYNGRKPIVRKPTIQVKSEITTESETDDSKMD